MLALPETANEFPFQAAAPAGAETHTLSAGESCSERIARHLETLREITELARGLARHLAADIAAAERQPATADEKSRRRGPDLRLMFDRVVRLIRDIIKLENIIGGWPNDKVEPAPPPCEFASPGAKAAPAQIGLSRHERRSLEKRLRLARGAQQALA